VAGPEAGNFISANAIVTREAEKYGAMPAVYAVAGWLCLHGRASSDSPVIIAHLPGCSYCGTNPAIV